MADAKYIIIGGGLAAGRACKGIREVDPEGKILIITEEPHFPYQRPPLSKKYLRGEDPIDKVFVESEDFYSENGIEVMTETRATRISRRSRKVALEDGNSLEYEELLLATGGRAWRLPLSGADLPGVFTLRTIEDSDAIRQAAQESDQAVVIGGSFIGSEVAASLTQLGTRVTMCFLEGYPLQAIAPPELGHYVENLFADQGIRVIPATRPERIEGAERVEHVRLENGEVLDANMVVMGVGIRLNTQLARDAELELTDSSAILVDENLRTSDPHIHAAGDIAAWPDPHYGKRLRVEHWDVAYNQGYQAGRNMAGADEPYTTVPYFFSDIFDLSFEVWGNLQDWDQTVTRGDIDEGSVAYWYFRKGILVGVLAFGRPDEERDPMQKLVIKGLAYDDVAEALQDEDQSLADLI